MMFISSGFTYIGDIIDNLKDLSISKEAAEGKREKTISKIIFDHLKNKGLKVVIEKQKGFLKFVIDIDYEDGKAGIEIKLAKRLISEGIGNSEIQRLFGQIYYYTKNYKNISPVVLVIVVGDKSYEKDPKIKAIKEFIENKMEAKFHYIAFHYIALR